MFRIPSPSRRLACAPLVLGALIAASPVAAPAADTRALDTNGRVLTVGGFALVRADGGSLLRVQSNDLLSWELHDQDRLVAHGIVPGSESPGLDASPSLSRDPVSGDTWLAWSRQVEPGQPSEIAWLRFRAAGPDASSLVTLATGAGAQVEPNVLHDEAGNAFIAFIDESNGRRVRLLGMSQTGSNLGAVDISEARSAANSSPRLGISAIGHVFVAYVGSDLASGEPSLYVAARDPRFGGVTHVPNPLVDLMRVQAALPAPTLAIEPHQTAFTPDLRLTVLGGTAIAWWTEITGDNRLLFRYVAEAADGWDGSSLQTIDLSTGTLGSVPDALELLEARLRRVITTGPADAAPQVPVPGRDGMRPGLTERR